MQCVLKFIVAYLIPLAIVATIWVGVFIAIKKFIEQKQKRFP